MKLTYKLNKFSGFCDNIINESVYSVNYWRIHRKHKCYACHKYGHLRKDCEKVCKLCSNYHTTPYCYFALNFYFKQLVSYAQKLYHIDSEENLLQQIEDFQERTQQTITDLAPFFKKKYELRTSPADYWDLVAEIQKIPNESEPVNPIDLEEKTERKLCRYVDPQKWIEDCSMDLRNKSGQQDLQQVSRELDVPNVLKYYRKCVRLKNREEELQSSVACLVAKKELIRKEIAGLNDKKINEYKIFAAQLKQKSKAEKRFRYEKYKQKVSSTLKIMEQVHQEKMEKLERQYQKNKMQYQKFLEKKQQQHEKFVKKLKNDIDFYYKRYQKCSRLVWAPRKCYWSTEKPDIEKKKGVYISYQYFRDRKQYFVFVKTKIEKTDEYQQNMWAAKIKKTKELLERVDRPYHS